MAKLTLQKSNTPFCTNTIDITEKLVTTCKTLVTLSSSSPLQAARLAFRRQHTEVPSRSAVHSLHPIPTSKTAPSRSEHHYPSNSQELFLQPSLPGKMDLTQAAHTNQHRVCNSGREQIGSN